MSVHREGYGIILAFLLSAIVLSGFIWAGVESVVLNWIAGLLWVLALFSVYFFRDPERTVPAAENAIVSPADGKVVEVSEIEEREYLQSPAKKVSIFMNVFDVHVNRSPIDGEVVHFRYQSGKFLRANLSEASRLNEQTIIGLRGRRCNIVFKQIAGLIARRISCDLREGHKVEKGERIGIIKFGSRVDIFMPVDVELRVRIGDRVKAGVSIIGEVTDVS